MPSARIITTALALSFLLACSGTDLSSPIGSWDSIVEDAEVDGGVAPEVDPDAPHALGTIVLGESHASGASTPRRIVAVSFVPDAALAKVATRNVAGCEHTPAATAAPKTPGAGVSESFDAGPVAVSGATTPITLYPPYTYKGENDGAPFLAGAKLEVQGSGAAGAGFEKFDETFTATQFLQASPALAQLPRTSVFGTGSLPVAWVAGSDEIAITVAGAGGSLRCKASDAEGRFEIPREVIKTGLGGSTNLSLSVARERTETRKGKKTRGELTGATVQPTGWLVLTTTSAETATFQCSGAECTGVTPTTCHDCRTSACKTELDACTADATCPMLRTCLDACADSACRNTCFTKWPEPAAKAKNGALYKCQCVTTCVSSCTAECR